MAIRITPDKLRIGAIALLLAAMAALLIYPWNTMDVLDRCQDLYERGEYETCGRVLAGKLRRDPDWHEGRELLVKAQLAANDPLAALPNFLYLLEAGSIGDMGAPIISQLLESDRDVQNQARLLLEERLAAQPELVKTREFLLQFELAANNLPGVLKQLSTLSLKGLSFRELEGQVARKYNDYSAWAEHMDQLQADNPHWSWPGEMKLLFALEHGDLELAVNELDELLAAGSRPQDLVARTFQLALERDLGTALIVAVKADQPFLVQDVFAQAEKLEPAELSSLLPQLLALLPDEPRLQALSAFYLLPPRQGLDLLLDLEDKGYVPPDPDKYLEKKILLLRQVHIFDFKYLKFLDERYLPPASLIDLAIECRQSNPSGLRELADYIDAHLLGFSRDTTILRDIAAFSGPTPKIIWQGPGNLSQPRPFTLSLSPNGKWLICSYSYQTIFVNLATGEETIFDTVAGQWRWSPDSSKAAAITATTLNTMVLNFTDTSSKIQGPSEFRLPDGYFILGWLDNRTLAIKEEDIKTRVANLDTTNGKLQWLTEKRAGWPTLNQAGELVWIVPEGGNLLIDTGKSKKTYHIYGEEADFEHLSLSPPLDWFPGNRKILFDSAFSPIYGHILNLDTGSYVHINLPWTYSPGNWADAQSIWEFYSFPELGSNYSPLVKTNLGTGKNEFTGIIIKQEFSGVATADILYCSAGKVIAVASNDGTQVYEMP